MQQALTFPFYRSLAVGGLLLALSVAQFRAKPEVHHLALHAIAQPGALYLTVWDHGDVSVAISGKTLVPLRFETRALINDGCQWLGTETLVPLDSRRYAYRYDETILACEPGATPYLKTPRTGIVTVDD
ncbi:MAG TPA: hypothetical protein VHN14_18735 [Kofleriaceae bacterium]|jgi:hypothetical protein|nr:hypothetical protein [Kofleriaceae bacterium]